jgi:hypothetical protein
MRNLRNWTVCSGIGLALSLGACGDDDDNGTSATTQTTQTTMDETGGTTADTSDDAETSNGETTADETTGEIPEVCIVTDEDDECAVCTKENCCDELAACLGDEVCACLVGCVNESDLSTDEAIAFCSEPEQCDIGGEEGQNPFPVEAVPLQTCNGANCADECE